MPIVLSAFPPKKTVDDYQYVITPKRHGVFFFSILNFISLIFLSTYNLFIADPI